MRKLLMVLLVVSSSLMAKDYGLIVSISQYQNSDIPTLNVSEDVRRYESVLKKMGFIGSCKYLKNESATRTNILGHIRGVAQTITDKDRFFMFFTGHGTDENDEDYGSKLQEALPEKYWKDTGMILPYDFNPNKKGIANSVIIGKRDLRNYFKAIDNNTDKALIVFDACFSENSSKGKLRRVNRFVHIDTKNKTYPYRNIVYIGASKTQAKTGKLSKVLDGCMNKDTTFVGLKGCMNRELSRSPHKAVVLSMSENPRVFVW